MALKFEERFHGEFVKLKEVEQNADGTIFAAAYIDNGTFKVRTFNV